MEEAQDKEQQLRDRLFNAYLATQYTTAETDTESLAIVRGEKYHENNGIKTTEFVDVVLTKEAMDSVVNDISNNGSTYICPKCGKQLPNDGSPIVQCNQGE